jgi:hypothetical protein
VAAKKLKLIDVPTRELLIDGLEAERFCDSQNMSTATQRPRGHSCQIDYLEFLPAGLTIFVLTALVEERYVLGHGSLGNCMYQSSSAPNLESPQ